MATNWSVLWDEINQRQQEYLTVLYRRDANAEDYHRSVAARDGGEKASELRKLPEAVSLWRWIPYHGDGGMEIEIAALGAKDPGTGSTWEALEARGYLERKWDMVTLVNGFGQTREKAMLSLRLTRRGRKLCREHFGEVSTATDRKHFWKAVRAYIAELLDSPRSFAVYLAALPEETRFAVSVGYIRKPDDSRTNPYGNNWVETGQFWQCHQALQAFLRERLAEEFDFGRDRFGAERVVPAGLSNKNYLLNENSKTPEELPVWAVAFHAALGDAVGALLAPFFEQAQVVAARDKRDAEERSRAEAVGYVYAPKPWRREVSWLQNDREVIESATGLRLRQHHHDVQMPLSLLLKTLQSVASEVLNVGQTLQGDNVSGGEYVTKRRQHI